MRIVAVVEGADIDVVDVEQEPASGASRQLGQEFPFRHFGIVELNVGRDILEHDGAAEEVLHQLDAADDMIERLPGVGDRQQIVQVLAVDAGPAQMVRHPFRLDASGEVLQGLQIFEIGRRGGGDRHRHAVHHHGIAFANPIERAQRLAAGQHVVFADDLEPVDRRIAAQDFVVMLVAQAETEAEEGRLGRCRRTVCRRRRRGVRQSARDVHLVSVEGHGQMRRVPTCRQPIMETRPGLHRASIPDHRAQDGMYLPLAASHFSLVSAEKP